MNRPDPAPNPNRVRDHLANERTYLAWIRTAVALMGFGVVIVRLRYFLPAGAVGTGHGWELGLVFTLVGLLTVFLSTWHYFTVRKGIDAARYEPSGGWVILFSLAIALVGAGVLYWLLTAPAPGLAAGPQAGQ